MPFMVAFVSLSLPREKSGVVNIVAFTVRKRDSMSLKYRYQSIKVSEASTV